VPAKLWALAVCKGNIVRSDAVIAEIANFAIILVFLFIISPLVISPVANNSEYLHFRHFKLYQHKSENRAFIPTLSGING
jgi:hypothetical protein